MGKQITFYQEHMISVYLKQKTIKNFVFKENALHFFPWNWVTTVHKEGVNGVVAFTVIG